MADLKSKVEDALNESRMLVLGVQVLLGFQYQVVFQTAFADLTRAAQYLHLAGLGLLLITLAGLMSPAPYHQLILDGNLSPSLLRFTTRAVGLALLPFSLGLSLDFYIVAERLGGVVFGVVAAALAWGCALLCWYAWEAFDRSRSIAQSERRPAMSKPSPAPPAGTPLTEKIKQVLTEARIVLPGVQALLAFQFMTFFITAFEQLPNVLKYAHLAALGLMAISMVLLMTPASYHRLVEQGEASERFHRLASRLLLAAMALLAAGIALDLWVVVEKISKSRAWGLASAGLALVLFYGLWFGYSWYGRRRAEPVKGRQPA